MAVFAPCPISNINLDQVVRDYTMIRYINARFVYSDEIENEKMPPTFQFNIERAADEFRPDQDYVLIVGDYLQLIAFTAALVERYGKFRVLRWDRHAEGYVVVWVGTMAAARRPVQVLTDKVSV